VYGGTHRRWLFGASFGAVYFAVLLAVRLALAGIDLHHPPTEPACVTGPAWRWKLAARVRKASSS